jgi:hypothetical protein
VALTVSPQIRILALVGLVLTAGFAGAMKMMGSSASSSTTAVVPSRNSALVEAKDTAARASQRTTHPTTATTAHERAATKPKAKAVQPAEVEPGRTAENPSPALAAGLPLSLAAELAGHSTVVAVVYNPQSRVDAIAFAEARAGAALAGVGFVGLNVLSRAEVGRLTERLGVLPDPAVLVFSRPATLSARIDGFADKETVAQAAENAARGT